MEPWGDWPATAWLIHWDRGRNRHSWESDPGAYICKAKLSIPPIMEHGYWRSIGDRIAAS